MKFRIIPEGSIFVIQKYDFTNKIWKNYEYNVYCDIFCETVGSRYAYKTREEAEKKLMEIIEGIVKVYEV